MGNPCLRDHTASFHHLPRSSDLLLLNYNGLPAAIHNAHVAQGEHKDFMEASTPHLQQVMKGIQREQAIVKYQRVCKPITITNIS